MGEKLEEGQVLLHPWVLGELIVGDLGKRRAQIILDLFKLPFLQAYSVEEINTFVENKGLVGKGLSFIDAQLLYCSLVDDCKLWTSDKILKKYSQQLGVHWAP